MEKDIGHSREQIKYKNAMPRGKGLEIMGKSMRGLGDSGMKWRVLAALAALMMLAGCHQQQKTTVWMTCDFQPGGCPAGTVRPAEQPYDKECDPLLCSVPRSPACPKGGGSHHWICKSSMAEALPWSAGERTYRITWDETFGGFPSYILHIRKDGAVIQATPHSKARRVTAEEAAHFEEVLKQSGFYDMGEFKGEWDCFDGTVLTVEAQTEAGYRVVEVDCADFHAELREPLNVLFKLAKAKGID